jgi:hypothetical protein
VVEEIVVMSKANSNKKVDDKHRRRKGGVLRAKDIIPAKADSKKTKIGRKKTSPSKGQKESEIPKFDLAEQILAEQRKVSSARRKAPSPKAEAPKQEQQLESVDYLVEQPSPAALERQQIIAEIVARDIEKLCRGNSERINPKH